MKRMIQLTGMLLFMLPFAVFAKDNINRVTYKRSLNFSFQVKNGATLELINKYGDIHFYSWDKNQIRSDITIMVKAGDEEEAKKIADAVNIQKDQNGNLVSLHTDYEPSGSSSFWNIIFGGTSGGKKNVRIDYKVYLPKSLGHLTVQNKYGNITGSNIPGTVSIKLDYGHFHLDHLQQALNFEVKYGSGSLTELAEASIDASYTDFHIDAVQHLKMHYKYSDLTFGTVGDISLDGSYGDITAESISELQSRTAYGDYKIRNLSEAGDISTAYGDVHIDQTGRLKDLKITARYSDVFLGIAEKQPLQFKIRLHYGNFNSGDFPLRDVKKEEDGSRMLVNAHTPDAGSGAAVIRIDGSYSDVKLLTR